MKEKIKMTWGRYRLCIATVVSVLVSVIGTYLILTSAKSHAELWPAIGSWVGGVATVFAVYIALCEYVASKKAKGISELVEITSIVNGEYWENWGFLLAHQLETYICLVEMRDISGSHKKLKENKFICFEDSLKDTRQWDKKFQKSYVKFCEQVLFLEFSAPEKYLKLDQNIKTIKDLKVCSKNFMRKIDPIRFNENSEEQSQPLIELAEKLSKKELYCSVINIFDDSDFKSYLEGVDKNIFKPFTEKAKTLN